MTANPSPHLFTAKRNLFIVLAVFYVVGAALASCNVIIHTQGSTTAIEQILKTYNMRNEGEQTLEQFSKQHPFLSFFFSGTVKKTMNLPSQEESSRALSVDVEHLLKKVRQESSVAAWWSWFLISLSLLYVVAVISLARSFNARPVLFALTAVSVFFFFIGILAPAMVIWTAPIIPMETGNFSFVVQHQVRGIAAIIWELITSDHWIIGGFLLLFSIVTPLTKASLTFVVTGSHSKERNFQIGQFLHTIGKWSMADVFVAAIILALYALKFQEATKSIPCLGLYYFIGYCMLSMTTTELMTRSGVVAGNDEKKRSRVFGGEIVAGLVVVFFCFASLSGLYTYQQYTENTKQAVKQASTPDKLNNADLVLPVHK